MSAPLPSISIVTPSFGQAKFLPMSICSVIGQQYPNLEYLVVDGGSDDASVEVIRAHASHIAWWCSESDGGQSAALNKGFRRCTGEVVGWLNSDDMLLPGCLKAVAAAFADPGVEAVCGWGVVVSEAGLVRRRWVFPQPTEAVLCSRSVLFQPSVFWRRRLFDRLGYLDESLSLCMDQEFFARLAAHGVQIRLLPRFLAAYRKHGGTKTSLNGMKGMDEYRRVRKMYGSSHKRSVWGLQSWALRLMLHKLTAVFPPYRRGTDVHQLIMTGISG